MGRNRLHATNADRQASYRLRVASQTARLPPAPNTTPRPASRPKRLAQVQKTVQELQHEYEVWLESLPESLQDTDQATRLAETIDQLEEVVSLLADIQPPRGFGRD